MSGRFIGYLAGIVSAVCYGLIPFFAKPLLDGLPQKNDVASVLFYRYVVALAAITIMMFVGKHRFRMTRREFVAVCVMGVLFAMSSIFLFSSYSFMPTGIASTILFCYPVMVAGLQIMFFGERLRAVTIGSMLMAVAGILLLYRGDGDAEVSVVGVLLVVLSALSYAVYIAGVDKSVLRSMSVTRLTFYVMLVGNIVFFARVGFGSSLQPIVPSHLMLNALALGLLPTVVSLVCLAISARRIGATYASILGALEPVTAVLVGAVAMGESLTYSLLSGMGLILSAVILIVVFGRK
ncbi:MAG: EamA family transporter [Bacteroidaceae bacterium]|nr:EamA family transporter [Bacteroidaceae bacterium]